MTRPKNWQALLKLKSSITGCLGLVTIGGSTRASDVLPVENDYVQSLIAIEEQKWKDGRWAGGSRVLTYGKPDPSACWYMVDISNDNRVEAVIRRSCQAAPKLFRDLPLENFYVDGIVFVR